MAIETQTFEGAPGGVNKALPPNEIADLEAAMILDAFVDEPGRVRRRGPVRLAEDAFTMSGQSFYGLAHTDTLDGEHIVAVWRRNNSSGDQRVSFLDAMVDMETGEFDWTNTGISGSDPYPLFDYKGMLGGGALIGTTDKYDIGAIQSLGMWRGGSLDDYSTTAGADLNVGNRSLQLTGLSHGANIAPGMFVFRTQGGVNELIGVVDVVSDNGVNTFVTLDVGALKTSASKNGATHRALVSGDAIKFTSIRGVNPRVTVGRITAVTTATTVAGAFTKFRSQGLNSGTWDLYRQSDFSFIGTVSSVTDDVTLTLAENSLLALNNEGYVAIQRDGAYLINNVPKVGVFVASYAGRQFYANLAKMSPLGKDQTARIWYSDTTDPEALDLTEVSGNYIEIVSGEGVSNSIRGIVGTQNALLIFKENATYALYGQTPAQWQVRKIADDGLLSTMAVQPYEGGALWAGRLGIYYYDGVQVRNLANEKLGDYLAKRLVNIDPEMTRLWSMIAREHYFLFVESLSPGTSIDIVKGASTTSYTAITVVINLRTGAFTFLTPNVSIRGALNMPAHAGRKTLWLTNTSGAGYIADADDLFDDTAGNDVLTTTGGAAGPNFYLESKRYSLGDGHIKKLWKQLQLHFIAVVSGGTDDVTDALSVDTVPGLNDTGTATVSGFKQRTTWKPKRLKFLKRDQYFGFRIYQAANVTRVVLGPWALGFKFQRKGRV